MNKYNNINMMHPELLRKYNLFKEAMNKAKIPFTLTSVARTVKEQKALYAQGRENITIVNKLRGEAGLPPILSANNIKVTWTLNSKHIIDLDSVDQNKHLSKAFDIAIIKDKVPSWNLKVDVNKNELGDYHEAGKIGVSLGLIWGGNFKSSPDYPHFEIGV